MGLKRDLPGLFLALLVDDAKTPRDPSGRRRRRGDALALVPVAPAGLTIIAACLRRGGWSVWRAVRAAWITIGVLGRRPAAIKAAGPVWHSGRQLPPRVTTPAVCGYCSREAILAA